MSSVEFEDRNMSLPIPPHRENLHTIGMASIQIFDGVAETLPPGTKARPRPADRPRPKVGEFGSGVFELQFFDADAEATPPDANEKPR